MSTDLIKYTTPEAVGVKSENIERYIRNLEEKHLATHNVILMRGNQIFYENYWAPFTPEFQHRMYSVSKSFVSLAIGFLEQDGLIHLDDPMSKYFAKELEGQPDLNMHNQTIRHMLMMSTAKPVVNWFAAQPKDRVQQYFANEIEETRPSGTIFQYDSPGSFVLGALVERLTGKLFMDYLREKMFDEIGVSKDAYCLKCPGGHSWGDSAVLCTPRDLLRVARFTLNGGRWNDKQLLNEAYVKAATGNQIDNNFGDYTKAESHGYGYLFWRTYQDSYFFNGMGSQFAVCVPGKDLILIHNGDNQGKDTSTPEIIDKFFDWIVDNAEDEPLPENPEANNRLLEYSRGLKLVCSSGQPHVAFEEELNGSTYTFAKNPMGITKMSFRFQGDKGTLSYTNEQGDKELTFGLGYNEFGLFPQEGYSTDVGSVFVKGNYYKCAASAGWVEEKKLRIMVQIIDRYFGNLTMTFGFRDGQVGVFMQKTAEYFLDEYVGFAHGTRI